MYLLISLDAKYYMYKQNQNYMWNILFYQMAQMSNLSYI